MLKKWSVFSLMVFCAVMGTSAVGFAGCSDCKDANCACGCCEHENEEEMDCACEANGACPLAKGPCCDKTDAIAQRDAAD